MGSLNNTPGVIAQIRRGLGIARVEARKGKAAELEQRFEIEFGIALPNTPRRVDAGDMAALAVAPGSWLVTAANRGNELALSLRPLIGSAAAICDQSDAYLVLRLTGAKLRRALNKLVGLDLHPRAFAVGDAAQTIAAHTGVLLWRLPDEDGNGSGSGSGKGEEAGMAPVFEMAIARSSSDSFQHALAHSAAEFGWELNSA